MYSENWTLGMKDYTERVSKHDDASFNLIFYLVNCCFYGLVILLEGFQWMNVFCLSPSCARTSS